MPQGHVLQRAARLVDGDQRAADTFRELVAVQWEHARALARERLSTSSTRDKDAHSKVAELEQVMNELERTLQERPWTEV